EGQAAARYALSDFVVRGYNDSASWAFFDDQMNGTTLVSHYPNKTIPTPLPRNMNRPAVVRTANRHAVCIDPTFFFDATTAESIVGNNSDFRDAPVYRPGLF